MDWRDEMKNMLAVFDRQATVSLNNIKFAFKRNGMSFNKDFKQFFLRTSNDRIKLTYDQFEFDSTFEDQIDGGADENMLIYDGSQNSIHSENHYMAEPIEPQNIDYIKIDDSSDEEDTSSASKLLENTWIDPGYDFTIKGPTRVTIMGGRSEEHGGTSTLANNYGESRIGSTIIRKRTTNPGTSSFDESIHNENNDFFDATEDKFIIPAVIEGQDARLNDKSRKNDAHGNKCTSTVTSNNRPKVADGTVRNHDLALQNNITRRSNTWSTAEDALRSKKLTSSNQLVTKKRFKCQLCEYSSNKKGNLNTHSRIHTGEKPYRCDICRKEFSQLNNMKMHKVTHTEQFPFHCRGCLNGFSQKAERDSHEKVCKSRRYECHICKKLVTVSITLLKTHMRKHNGEKPFRCEICMKHFTLKGNLKTHLNTIHTRINP